MVEILRIQMLFTSAIYYTGSLIHLTEKLEFAEDKKAITKMKEEYERRVKEDLWSLHREIIKLAKNNSYSVIMPSGKVRLTANRNTSLSLIL